MDDFADESLGELEAIEIDLLLQALYLRYGYDYRDYMKNSIRRRIWHRVNSERLPSITALTEKVLHDQSCLNRLIADFSINVTEMFRDPPFFKSFRDKVVPLLRTYPSLRIWHAGCSSGEEVYSMAILLHEEGLYERTKMYATDINARMLKKAKSGTMSLEYMRKYTNQYIVSGGKAAFSDYYSVEAGRVKLHPFLTKNIVFAKHNLATDTSFNAFNVILCRNVLIYFNRTLQERVHDLFYDSLSMFGILGLGDKESIAQSRNMDCFEAFADNQKIYRKVK